jgi:hypothetical protein
MSAVLAASLAGWVLAASAPIDRMAPASSSTQTVVVGQNPSPSDAPETEPAADAPLPWAEKTSSEESSTLDDGSPPVLVPFGVPTVPRVRVAVAGNDEALVAWVRGGLLTEGVALWPRPEEATHVLMLTANAAGVHVDIQGADDRDVDVVGRDAIAVLELLHRVSNALRRTPPRSAEAPARPRFALRIAGDDGSLGTALVARLLERGSVVVAGTALDAERMCVVRDVTAATIDWAAPGAPCGDGGVRTSDVEARALVDIAFALRGKAIAAWVALLSRSGGTSDGASFPSTTNGTPATFAASPALGSMDSLRPSSSSKPAGPQSEAGGEKPDASTTETTSDEGADTTPTNTKEAQNEDGAQSTTPTSAREPRKTERSRRTELDDDGRAAAAATSLAVRWGVGAMVSPTAQSQTTATLPAGLVVVDTAVASSQNGAMRLGGLVLGNAALLADPLVGELAFAGSLGLSTSTGPFVWEARLAPGVLVHGFSFSGYDSGVSLAPALLVPLSMTAPLGGLDVHITLLLGASRAVAHTVEARPVWNREALFGGVLLGLGPSPTKP